MHFRLYACVFAVLLFFPGRAQSAPILLGAWDDPVVLVTDIPAPATGFSFALGYDFPLGPDAFLAASVGGAPSLPLGFLGSVDFAGATVDAIEARLVDTIDEIMWLGFIPYKGTKPITMGGAGAPEESLFGPQSSRATWDLAFLRLVLIKNTVRENSPPTLDVRARLRWEVWGTGTPTTTVPEPALFALFGLASALAGRRVLRRRRSRA